MLSILITHFRNLFKYALFKYNTHIESIAYCLSVQLINYSQTEPIHIARTQIRKDNVTSFPEEDSF